MATLPSSPPVRRARPASRSRSRSQSPSDYSLDLDALMPPEDDSEIATPLPAAQIDVVHSEDIDGPTDFTQNLEYWMTAKLPNVTRPSHMTGQARNDLEEYVSEGTEVHVEANEKKDSLLDSETPRKGGDGMSFLSNIPSSLHAEDAQSSTPKTVEHVPATTKKEFQASVEDHDDTPSRIRESSSAIGATLRSPEHTVKTRSLPLRRRVEHDEESETVRSLRQTLVKLREELDEVRSTSQRELGRVRSEHEDDIKLQKARQDTQLQKQERHWQRRLSSARTDHEERMKAMATAKSTDDKDGLLRRIEKLDRQTSTQTNKISDLEEDIAHWKERHAKSQARVTEVSAERDAALENCKALLAAQQEAQQLALKASQDWQSERETLAKAKTDAEKMLESIHAEISNLTMEHANEIDELTSRIEDAASATQRAVIQEQRAAQATIEDLERENNRLHNRMDSKDDEIEALGDELRVLRIKTSGVTEVKEQLSTKLRQQKTLNDQAAREIQSLRSGTKILQAKLSDAESRITDAESRATDAESRFSEVVGKVTNGAGMETADSQLAEANAARLEADAEVDDLKAQVESLTTSLEVSRSECVSIREEYTQYKLDCELVNKAMDKRMRELMRAREAEWAKRIEALKKEMGFRGEVLMREWGKAELGVSEPQAYRYKFV